MVKNERISKYSYSEVVKKLLAHDALKSRNSTHHETENNVNHRLVESSSRSPVSQNPTIDFKYVDTLRMSKRKTVKFAFETLV